MSKRQRNILMCAGGLFVGAVLYILFREGAYVSGMFNSLPWIEYVRGSLKGKWADWFSFYVPDFLWAFSLSCGIQAICLPERRGIVTSAATAFFCGLIWELLQWMDVVSGTGDFWDVLMYFLGSALTIIINIKERKNEKA